MLSIALESDGPFQLGDSVRGQLHWRPDGDSRYKGAEVTLGWRTEGRGTKQSETVGALKGSESGTVDAAAGMNIDFEFALPNTGPASYNGSLLRIIWSISGRIDIPWAIDDKASVDITVVDQAP